MGEETEYRIFFLDGGSCEEVKNPAASSGASNLKRTKGRGF